MRELGRERGRNCPTIHQRDQYVFTLLCGKLLAGRALFSIFAAAAKHTHTHKQVSKPRFSTYFCFRRFLFARGRPCEASVGTNSIPYPSVQALTHVGPYFWDVRHVPPEQHGFR